MLVAHLTFCIDPTRSAWSDIVNMIVLREIDQCLGKKYNWNKYTYREEYTKKKKILLHLMVVDKQWGSISVQLLAMLAFMEQAQYDLCNFFLVSNFPPFFPSNSGRWKDVQASHKKWPCNQQATHASYKRKEKERRERKFLAIEPRKKKGRKSWPYYLIERDDEKRKKHLSFPNKWGDNTTFCYHVQYNRVQSTKYRDKKESKYSKYP